MAWKENEGKEEMVTLSFFCFLVRRHVFPANFPAAQRNSSQISDITHQITETISNRVVSNTIELSNDSQ